MIPMLEGRIENGLKMYGGRTAPELKEKLTRTKTEKVHPIDTFRNFMRTRHPLGRRLQSAVVLTFLVKIIFYLLLICRLIRKKVRDILTGH